MSATETVSEILAPWEAVDAALGLSAPLRDEAHYEALLAFVEECFDRFGADEFHPVFALVDLVAVRIREYEDRVHPWPDTTTPASRLAFLMEQHGLRQADLPEIGQQSVVSAVLAGKRKLNLRQVKLLAARFHVPMEALAG
jgi:HTH-type transcriptional regulator/antitoxin HigA